MKRSLEDGFTLVELMVALFIFALLAAAGVGLLSFGVRAQAQGTARLDEIATVRRMSMLMASDLAQAVPRVARGADGGSIRAFTGNDGTSDPLVLGYVRNGRSNFAGAPRASVQRVDVRLIDGQLIRQGLGTIDGVTTHSDAVLADQVTTLAMRYRDRLGEWHPRWDNVALDSLPAAVEMTVTRAHGPSLTFDWACGTPYP